MLLVHKLAHGVLKNSNINKPAFNINVAYHIAKVIVLKKTKKKLRPPEVIIKNKKITEKNLLRFSFLFIINSKSIIKKNYLLIVIFL